MNQTMTPHSAELPPIILPDALKEIEDRYDIGYLEELQFQISDHQEKLDREKYPTLHKALDVAVKEILLLINQAFANLKRVEQ